MREKKNREWSKIERMKDVSTRGVRQIGVKKGIRIVQA